MKIALLVENLSTILNNMTLPMENISGVKFLALNPKNSQRPLLRTNTRLDTKEKLAL